MRHYRSIIWLLAALAVMTMPVVAMAQIIGINITIAPPQLPVYEQPAIPAPGYIWTPGYWAYGPDGYYWVPGTWVEPPQVGLLWTPGYWGWHGGYYGWNAGYWGSHVGFYGGVDYGFGYGGNGYGGGRWNNGVFAYNRTVNNFGGVAVTNVYNQTVVNNNTTNITRTSFNGGTGGTTVQPTPQEQAFAHEQHVAPTAVQTQHQQTAGTNRSLLASENHGHPAIAATAKPGEFTGKGVVASREAGPTAARPAATPTPAALPAGGTKPPVNRPVANATPENKGSPVAVAHATTNSAVPSKPLTTAAKPSAARPQVAPHPAAPRMAAVTKPPAPPHVAAPRSAPHPVAARPAPRPAPHPPARPKAPPPHNEH